MDFVIAYGTDLEAASASLATHAIEQSSAPGFAITRFGPYQLGSTGLVQSEDRRRGFVFDGQMVYRKRFYHPLLIAADEGGLASRFESILSDHANPANGLYCLGVITADSIRLITDPLSQYPLYVFRSQGNWLVSNNFGLLVAALEASHTLLTRSVAACIDNIVFGGVLDEKTHVREINRVPFGCAVSVRGSVLSYVELREMPSTGEYADVLRMAADSITDHVQAVADSTIGMPRHVMADITGGTDSRCVLSFLMKSPFRHEITGRCITRLPNSDARVAHWIMADRHIPIATVPAVRTVKAALEDELAVRMNSVMWGGGRDSASPVPPIAFRNLIHFKGNFGEIGGATPGINLIVEIERTGDYSPERLVDLMLSRRRMARALELITEGALAEVRAALIGLYRRIEEQGIPRDQLQSEIYLRTRARNHFGQYSSIENRTRILPDILCNPWVVAAKRLLPSALHCENKVIFDLTCINDVELTFSPMADKKWARAVVPEIHQNRLATMEIMRSTGPTSSERLFRAVPLNECCYDKYQPLTSGATPGERSQFALAASIGPYQNILKYFLDNLDTTDPVWDLFDRRQFINYSQRQMSDFSSNGLDTGAMGRAAAGILWKADLGIQPKIRQIKNFEPPAVEPASAIEMAAM